MARDVGNRDRGMVGCIPEKVQKELGILVIPVKQYSLDCLGLARRSLCTHPATSLSSSAEHQRRNQESHGVRQAFLSVFANGGFKFQVQHYFKQL